VMDGSPTVVAGVEGKRLSSRVLPVIEVPEPIVLAMVLVSATASLSFGRCLESPVPIVTG